jgi:hypothetical protein
MEKSRLHLYVLIAILVSVALTSCFSKNNKPVLKTKKGTDIVLYQGKTDRIFIRGLMRELNKYVGIKNDNNVYSDFVYLHVNLIDIDSILVQNFSIKIWCLKSNKRILLKTGEISYNSPNSNLYDQCTSIRDSVKGFLYKQNPEEGRAGTLFIIKSDESTITGCSKFIVSTRMKMTINNHEIIHNQTDTLYRNVVTNYRITAH